MNFQEFDTPVTDQCYDKLWECGLIILKKLKCNWKNLMHIFLSHISRSTLQTNDPHGYFSASSSPCSIPSPPSVPSPSCPSSSSASSSSSFGGRRCLAISSRISWTYNGSIRELTLQFRLVWEQLPVPRWISPRTPRSWRWTRRRSAGTGSPAPPPRPGWPEVKWKVLTIGLTKWYIFCSIVMAI